MTDCPWVCPVCREPLGVDGKVMACAEGHRYDIARQGYVNLLVAGQRRSRRPGDSPEMIAARTRFLATGAYERLGNTVAWVVGRAAVAALEHQGMVPVVLDVGCGDGHHTRRIASNMTLAASGLGPVPAVVCGIDVAKAGVATAARAHPSGWYAVASAADLPLAPASVDVAVNVFGPVVEAELARVMHGRGTVVVAHPGPRHLEELRRLVYATPRPHAAKDPMRHGGEWFTRAGSVSVTFPFFTDDAQVLRDLFAMTPYRWHAPPDIGDRLDHAASEGFTTDVDVVITSYSRRPAS